MRRLKIVHLTEYRFATFVTLEPHRLLLRPRESHALRIESAKLTIQPEHTIRWSRDALNNSVALVNFLEASNLVRILNEVSVRLYEDAPLDFVVEEYAVTYPFDYAPEELPDLAAFRQSVYLQDEAAVKQWLDNLGCLGEPIETYVLLDRMNHDIAKRFIYQSREAPGVQSPALTLASGTGSCRDFAALFIEGCRHLGLASRFVSGYLDVSGHVLNAVDYTRMGRGLSPGPGWKGFDPTSGELTDNHHIPIAVARHPEAVPPVAGSFVGPAGRRPEPLVSVQVTAID